MQSLPKAMRQHNKNKVQTTKTHTESENSQTPPLYNN